MYACMYACMYAYMCGKCCKYVMYVCAVCMCCVYACMYAQACLAHTDTKQNARTETKPKSRTHALQLAQTRDMHTSTQHINRPRILAKTQRPFTATWCSPCPSTRSVPTYTHTHTHAYHIAHASCSISNAHTHEYAEYPWSYQRNLFNLIKKKEKWHSRLTSCINLINLTILKTRIN